MISMKKKDFPQKSQFIQSSMLCEGSREPVIHLCLCATHSCPSILPYLHFSSLPPPSSDQTIIWKMAMIDTLGEIVLHLMYMYMWLIWFHWLSRQTKPPSEIWPWTYRHIGGNRLLHLMYMWLTYFHWLSGPWRHCAICLTVPVPGLLSSCHAL